MFFKNGIRLDQTDDKLKTGLMEANVLSSPLPATVVVECWLRNNAI